MGWGGTTPGRGGGQNSGCIPASRQGGVGPSTSRSPKTPLPGDNLPLLAFGLRVCESPAPFCSIYCRLRSELHLAIDSFGFQG